MPGFFYSYLFISVLTKASRTISKIEAKIKPGICFCDCHLFFKSKIQYENCKLNFVHLKKFFLQPRKKCKNELDFYAGFKLIRHKKTVSLIETALRLPAKINNLWQII